MSAEKWAELPLLAFDLETTGIDTFTDRIVQAALVELPGRMAPNRRPKTTTWLVNPGVDIPEAASDVHGITTDHARTHGGDPGQMLFELTGRLALWMGHGYPIVGMNLAYDLTMLEAENTRHGVDTLGSRLPKGIGPVLDVLVLDKYADPYRKGGRRLEQLCTVYGVTHTGAHDAAGDALAAARVFTRLMATHAKKFPGHTWGSLHLSQVKWRLEQQQSLRAFFDKKGTPHDGVCGEWPVHSRCAAAAVAGVRA